MYPSDLIFLRSCLKYYQSISVIAPQPCAVGPSLLPMPLDPSTDAGRRHSKSDTSGISNCWNIPGVVITERLEYHGMLFGIVIWNSTLLMFLWNSIF